MLYLLIIYRFEPPPYQSVLSSTREFAIHGVLSPFDERDNSENPERGINDMSPGEIFAIVIAALTLLVGIIPLLRWSRFHDWVSSISPTVKVYPPFLTLPKPIHTHIPNSVILHRKLSVLSSQTLVDYFRGHKRYPSSYTSLSPHSQ